MPPSITSFSSHTQTIFWPKLRTVVSLLIWAERPVPLDGRCVLRKRDVCLWMKCTWRTASTYIGCCSFHNLSIGTIHQASPLLCVLQFYTFTCIRILYIEEDVIFFFYFISPSSTYSSIQQLVRPLTMFSWTASIYFLLLLFHFSILLFFSSYIL
jgi:hypothetical protein